MMAGEDPLRLPAATLHTLAERESDPVSDGGELRSRTD